MEETILTIRSLTFAQRAQRMLEKRGIRAQTLRVPSGLVPEGCAYALRLPSGRLREIRLLLEQAQLHPGRAFTRRGDGPWSEVRL